MDSDINETECFSKVESVCKGGTYSDRYDNASAAWVVLCAILMFFMKAGFLYVEESFSHSDRVFRRRVVLAKYLDVFAGTISFWLFGYAISGNTDATALGEEQDYIFWFFRFTFATNTATIIGGTLVGQRVHMRAVSAFVYSFVMAGLIHPSLARIFWSSARSDAITWSPYEYCNGTFTATSSHNFTFHPSERALGNFVFFDFAGSGLVHLCGGIGSFALSFFHLLETNKRLRIQKYIPLLKRKETAAVGAGAEMGETLKRPSSFLEWMYPSGGGEENVESAALGILILWTTWFAFNAGSTESITGKFAHAAVGRIALTMSIAAATGGLTQSVVSGMVQIYKRDETFNSNEIANGVLASLVAVTGCCPFIRPPWAALIGITTIGIYHLGCLLEYALGLHDGARVFPVHAVSGFWGLLCVGIFSETCLIQELYEDLCFCQDLTLPDQFKEQGFLFAYQLAGGLFIALWSLTFCGILFLILWFIPVKLFLTCLPFIFRFKDEKKGKIEFEGNILFTHFGEIGSPAPELPNTQELNPVNN